MDERAIKNFKDLGFVVDQDLKGGGTAETQLGIVDVRVDSYIPGHGNLILPVEKRVERILMEKVFSTMGEGGD